MDTIHEGWDGYRSEVDLVPEHVDMSEASYFAGALAMLLLIAAGGDVSALVQEIECYGISCPSLKKH